MKTDRARVSPPAGRAGKWSGRTPLLAALVGSAVFVVSGVGSFVQAGGYDFTSINCDSSSRLSRCIPALPLDAVADVLAAEGYECEPGEYVFQETTVCGMRIGTERLSVELVPGAGNAERIHTVRASFGDELPNGVQGSGARIFLAWSASLPFGGDPEAVGEVTTWLNEQLDGGQDAQTVIGGYDFRLDRPASSQVTLEISVDHVPHHR